MTLLPAGWRSAPLGDVCVITSGATPKTSVASYWGGDVPWITPADMSRDRSKVLTEGARSLTQEGLDSCSAALVPKGSVVFSSRAPIGYVAIAGTDLATNQGCKSATPPRDIDSNYLYYYLQHVTPEIRSRASGTTFQEISGKKFAETTLVWPTLDEQRHIVNVLEDHLSRLDVARASLELLAVRGHALESTWINERLGTSPSVALGDVLSEPLINGRSVPTADQGFPVLRLTSLRDGRIDLSEAKFGDWTADEARPFLVAAGDFLVARGNGSLRLVGRGGMVQDVVDPVAFPDTMIRIRPDTRAVHTDFLAVVWHSRFVRSQIEAAARTTAGIYKVNQKDIQAIHVPLPGLKEQRRFMVAFDELNEVVRRVKGGVRVASEQSNALRRSLLRAAFAGELPGVVSNV